MENHDKLIYAISLMLINRSDFQNPVSIDTIQRIHVGHVSIHFLVTFCGFIDVTSTIPLEADTTAFVRVTSVSPIPSLRWKSPEKESCGGPTLSYNW